MRFLPIVSLAILALASAGCPSNGGTHAATPTPPPFSKGPGGVTGEKPATLDQFPDLAPIAINIDATGFVPSTIPAKKGEKIALAFTRTAEQTCATEVVFDDLGGLEAKLPLNETVRVSFVVPKSGDVWFGCAMQRMIRGKILAADG